MSTTAASLCVALLASSAPDYQALLDEIRSESDLPGISAALVQDGVVVFTGGTGVADLATGQLMTADTVLYTGSVSKVLTAVLALQLVESGALSLDDPVPYVQVDSEPVRIHHLLTHTSGLVREGDFGYWFSGEFPDRERLTTYLDRTRLRGAPGADLHYSNIGYGTLGLVIEDALDARFQQVLRERLLERLGMAATGVAGPFDHLANGYSPPGRLIPSESRPFAGVREQVGNRHERMYHDARAMAPAFGIYSSAADMAKLLRFLLAGDDGVLKLASREQLWQRQAGGRGMVFRIRERDGQLVARHDGWFAAHRAHVLLDISAGIGVVVLANSDDAATGRIGESLYEALLSAR